MNVRSAAFRLGLLAVYAWGMGVSFAHVSRAALPWIAATFALAAVGVAGAVGPAAPLALATACRFVVVPIAVLAPALASEARSPGALGPLDFAAIAVGLAAYLAGAFAYARRAPGRTGVLVSPLEGEAPRDPRRAVRALFLAVAAIAAGILLVGPLVLVPEARLAARWGESARAASALSALANSAVAAAWLGLSLRHAMRRQGAAERIATPARARRAITMGAAGLALALVAWSMR